MSDPLQHNNHVDFHPHTTTMAAGARLAKYSQTVVSRDVEKAWKCVHHIHVPEQERVGYYQLDVTCVRTNEFKSHKFDIELLLSMRDNWKEYVEKHVLRMMKETLDAL